MEAKLWALRFGLMTVFTDPNLVMRHVTDHQGVDQVHKILSNDKQFVLFRTQQTNLTPCAIWSIPSLAYLISELSVNKPWLPINQQIFFVVFLLVLSVFQIYFPFGGSHIIGICISILMISTIPCLPYFPFLPFFFAWHYSIACYYLCTSSLCVRVRREHVISRGAHAEKEKGMSTETGNIWVQCVPSHEMEFLNDPSVVREGERVLRMVIVRPCADHGREEVHVGGGVLIHSDLHSSAHP